MVSTRHRSPDPLYGYIGIPIWFLEIEKFPSIRRMMLIRQLGLKAYIDFPCAIHTRYSHSLGVMELAKRLVELLIIKQGSKGRTTSAKNLEDNKNNLMAAGLLHDIGHGPFSHVLDYPLWKLCKKSHEDVSIEIIQNDMQCLENYGISLNAVKKLIKGVHAFPFLYQIINGPIDVDKLDYLLRDSYHVGLKYSFDIDHFINNFIVLGNENDLSSCLLGLESIPEAITSLEIFVVIWKSMYDLVYYSKMSRIAELMLEKAILIATEQDEKFRSTIMQLKNYVEVHDEDLLKRLENVDGYPSYVVEGIRNKFLFKKIYEKPIKEENFDMSEKFLHYVTNSKKEQISSLSDEISIKLCESLNVERYNIICDITKSRTPGDIYLDTYTENNEPYDARSRSDILPAIKQKIDLKIYVKPSLKEKMTEDLLNPLINDLLSAW